MISIIIPTYNSAKTIRRCVESIIASSTSETQYEIIIIDDGSTDETADICLSIRDGNERIKYYYKENEGVSIARNEGIKHSVGDYICFVDSDDTVDESYLKTIDFYAGNADIIFFGFEKKTIITGKTTKYIPRYSKCEKQREKIENTISKLLVNQKINYFGFTWSKIFQAEIIKRWNINFDANLSIKEDEIFTLEYCRHISSIMVLDTSLYKYNVFKGSLSHSSIKIKYGILSDYYKQFAEDCQDGRLQKILYSLSLSNRLGQTRTLASQGKNVMSLIRKEILPILNMGHGCGVSRWMPFVPKIPTNVLKALFIKLMILRNGTN